MDAQRLPAELAASFDVVIAFYGVLPWTADVAAWMTDTATALRPDGALVLIDGYPLTQMVDTADPVRFDLPYQGGAAHCLRSTTFYAERATRLRTTHTVQYPRSHPSWRTPAILGAAVGAPSRYLVDAHRTPAAGEPAAGEPAAGVAGVVCRRSARRAIAQRCVSDGPS